MVKFFKKEDIINTRFAISNEQNYNNILADLLIGNDEDDALFPLFIPTYECDDNQSGSCNTSLNPEVFLEIDNNKDDDIKFEIGKNLFTTKSCFFPTDSKYYDVTTNPTNSNGTYQGLVYNTIKKMYYNNYNNCYNIFGSSTFDISRTNKTLAKEISVFTLTVNQAGDEILPKSVVINNQSGDIVTDIIDDGNGNLILSGTFFVENYELTSSSNLIDNLGLYGVGKIILS